MTAASFVAAMLGFYSNETRVTFADVGLDTTVQAPSPARLPALSPGVKIQIAADPREIETEWIDSVLSSALVESTRVALSHNAADAVIELIRVSIPYVLLVWNPFVTSIAEAAGADAYALIRDWLKGFLGRVAERRNPIVEIQSFQDGCQVSFIFRGNEVKGLYAAYSALSEAAAQAAQLITKMNGCDMLLRTLTYEFDAEASRWYPSYAELRDGRLVSDKNILVAFEQLPTGLSIGLIRREET